jgi:hypothetical protein
MFFVNISELCTTSFSLSQMNDSVDPALPCFFVALLLDRGI